MPATDSSSALGGRSSTAITLPFWLRSWRNELTADGAGSFPGVQLLAGWRGEQLVGERARFDRFHRRLRRDGAHPAHDRRHGPFARHPDLHLGLEAHAAGFGELAVHPGHGLGLTGHAFGGPRIA